MAAPSRVIVADGSVAPEITVHRKWNAGICRSYVTNNGRHPASIKEIVLAASDRGIAAMDRKLTVPESLRRDLAA